MPAVGGSVMSMQLLMTQNKGSRGGESSEMMRRERCCSHEQGALIDLLDACAELHKTDQIGR